MTVVNRRANNWYNFNLKEITDNLVTIHEKSKRLPKKRMLRKACVVRADTVHSKLKANCYNPLKLSVESPEEYFKNLDL